MMLKNRSISIRMRKKYDNKKLKMQKKNAKNKKRKPKFIYLKEIVQII